MTRRDYREMLTQLRSDLADLEKERETIEHRIAKLRQSVIMLGGLCDDPEPIQTAKVLRDGRNPKGLTGAVLSTLLASDLPMDASEIRKVLVSLGYPFKSSNVLASIYSVLKRLRERGQVDLVSGPIESNERGTYVGTAYAYPYHPLPDFWEVVPLTDKSRKRKTKRE